MTFSSFSSWDSPLSLAMLEAARHTLASHDARFLLVGTMNAEEGELRPQLLDRFGLGVDVVTGRHDPPVGQQQSRGVVAAVLGLRSAESPRPAELRAKLDSVLA